MIYALVVGLGINSVPLSALSFSTVKDENLAEKSSSVVKTIVKELREDSKIVMGAVGAAILYGIANDQITARVCHQYFSEGFHRSMIKNDSISCHMIGVTNPTLLGLFWGVAATWWFGLLLGVPVAAAARIGKWPKLEVGDLIKPVGAGIAGLGTMGLAAGIYGYLASYNGCLSLKDVFRMRRIAGKTPLDAMDRYIANAYAHDVAYEGGVLVAVGIIAEVLHERYKRSLKEKQDQKDAKVLPR
jgi:hypothetical protein